MHGAGGYGGYWSSTSRETTTAWMLYINQGVSPGISSARSDGWSIRCVSLGTEPSRNIEVTVDPAISLSMPNEVTIKREDYNPSVVDINLEVISNQKYIIQINSTNPNLTSATTTTTIPSKSGTLTSDANAWGIKKLTTGKIPAPSFTAVTKSNQTFYTSSVPESTTLLFPIGISISPDIPNGEYSTDITITATQN